MSKLKALTVNGDLSAGKVNCNQFESGNGVVTIDVEGNVSIDSCAGPNGCEGGDLHCEGIVSCADFKVYKTGETYTSSSSTPELIAENLSGVMLWISDDGTFYKDAGFEFKNNIDIEGNCSCNALIQASDQKLKSNIEHIQEKDIQSIMELEPVSFQWKKNIIENKNKDSTKKIYGFIAQDVQKTFPDIVDDSGDMLHMDYIQIIPLLLEKIKQMHTTQEQQQTRIRTLETKLDSIEKMLSKNN
jgi:hypothetical protein